MNCDTKNYNASHGGLDKNKDRWKDEVKKSKQYDSCSNTCMYNDCWPAPAAAWAARASPTV